MTTPVGGWPKHYVVMTSIFQYLEQNFPGSQLSRYCLVAPFHELVLKARRAKQPRRIDFRTGGEVRVPGKVLIELPNDTIDNLNKPPAERDAFFLVRVRNSVLKQMESPIILPGEKKV